MRLCSIGVGVVITILFGWNPYQGDITRECTVCGVGFWNLRVGIVILGLFSILSTTTGEECCPRASTSSSSNEIYLKPTMS